MGEQIFTIVALDSDSRECGGIRGIVDLEFPQVD